MKSPVFSAVALHKSSLNFPCSLGWMGIKRSLQSNELIYAWALKLADKDSLSNTGSKVHGFGSLYQSWVRITKMQIIYYIYRMEELIILYYGNFAILGERARDFAWHTSCSNGVADRTLRSQIFLNELRREHLGWTTSHRQEWGLFLLEHLLHYVASVKKKRVPKVLPKITEWGDHRRGHWTSLCESPLRFYEWHHHPSGQKGLLRGADPGSKHAFPSSAWQLHEGIVAGVEQMYG